MALNFVKLLRRTWLRFCARECKVSLKSIEAFRCYRGHTHLYTKANIFVFPKYDDYTLAALTHPIILSYTPVLFSHYCKTFIQVDEN